MGAFEGSRTGRLATIRNSAAGPLPEGHGPNAALIVSAIRYGVDKGAFVLTMSVEGTTAGRIATEQRAAMDFVRQAERADGTIQAFDAVVAGDRAEVEARLRARHGSAFADAVEISEGFDPNTPMAEALVSSTVADMLAQVAADPGSPLARGLSVYVEQRFAA